MPSFDAINAAKPNFAYVYFDIFDYTNTSTASSYSFQQTPLNFVPDITNISVLSGKVISNKSILWDFGDGVTSREFTPTHWYKWPGRYTVSLTIFDEKNTPYRSLYIPTVTIHNFVPDAIDFVTTKKFLYDMPASSFTDPIRVNMFRSWQQTRNLSSYGFTVNLYASGAAADYANVEEYYNDKWAHLKSLSRFYERRKFKDSNSEQYIVTNQLTAYDDILYGVVSGGEIKKCSAGTQGSFVIGSSATAIFYYVDDRPKAFTARQLPIIIFATLDNSNVIDRFTIYNDQYINTNTAPYSYLNTRPAVLPIIKVRHNPATTLSITTNGIDGEGDLKISSFYLPEISFQNTQIPVTVRMKDVHGFTTKTYPPLYCTQQAATSADIFDTQIGLVKIDNDGNRIAVPNIKMYDDFDNDAPREIGAFYKGYMVANTATTNCILTASLSIKDPLNFPSDCLLGWIAAPNNDSVIRFFRQFYFDFCNGSLNVTFSAIQDSYNVNGLRDIYSIQVAPSGAGDGNDYQTWMADGVRDQIIKLSIYGELLSAFSLSAMPTAIYNPLQSTYDVVPIDYRSRDINSAAPGSMVLDGKNNLWVALFDSVSCIKIDSSKGFVTHIAVPNPSLPGFENYALTASELYNLPALSGFAGENLFLPASIDTDYENNLYVAYTHPVANVLVKYDTTGKQLSSAWLPWVEQPAGIIVDRDSNVWVSVINLHTNETSLTARNDFLYKFDTNLDLVQGYPLTGFKGIGDLTLDGRQNLWTFHDRETIVKIDAETNERTEYPGGSGSNQSSYIQSIGAIAADTSDYIWVVNSLEGKIYLIDTYSSPYVTVDDYITSDLYAIPGYTSFQLTSAYSEKAFVGYGDWLGHRWVNKYMTYTTLQRVITGETPIFNIYPLSGQQSIMSVNENFNALDFYKNLAYQNILIDKKVLFDNFIGSAIGSLASTPNTLGKVVYSKIANFTDSVANVDTANLNQLISFCQELAVDFESYNYPFPPELRRIVDLCSINQKRLWGEKNQFNLDFDIKQTYTADSPYGKNIGAQVSILSGLVATGEPIVARELFTDRYSLVNVPAISSNPFGQIVPLSSWNDSWGWGLITSPQISGAMIKDFYMFYRYKTYTPDVVFNNVIDWANPKNTLTFNNSSYEMWSKDNGLVQSLITYELTKGLRLFLSGSNLAYNN